MDEIELHNQGSSLREIKLQIPGNIKSGYY